MLNVRLFATILRLFSVKIVFCTSFRQLLATYIFRFITVIDYAIIVQR